MGFLVIMFFRLMADLIELASQTFVLIKTFSHVIKTGSLKEATFLFYDLPAPELALDDFGWICARVFAVSSLQ